jgi:hypothetical protein
VKVYTSILLLLCCFGCTTTEEEKDVHISTIDSNTVKITDTAPPLLYLDNPRLDSFPMAMDSAGPTILPGDTIYQKPGE